MAVTNIYNDCAREIHASMGTSQKTITGLSESIIARLVGNIVEASTEEDQIEAWSVLESFYASYQRQSKALGKTPPGSINMNEAHKIIQKHFPS